MRHTRPCKCFLQYCIFLWPRLAAGGRAHRGRHSRGGSRGTRTYPDLLHCGTQGRAHSRCHTYRCCSHCNNWLDSGSIRRPSCLKKDVLVGVLIILSQIQGRLGVSALAFLSFSNMLSPEFCSAWFQFFLQRLRCSRGFDFGITWDRYRAHPR